MTWLVSWTATPAHSPNDGCVDADHPSDRRVEEHGQRPEQRDGGDRVGDLSGPCPDDRGGRDDRGVAADRRSDGDQERQAALDPDEPGDERGRPRTKRHRDDDEPDRRQPDPGDLREAQTGAEQHDPEAQDALGREAEAGLERPEARAGDRRDDDAEQDGDRDLGDDRGQEPGERTARRDRRRSPPRDPERSIAPRRDRGPGGSGRCELGREPPRGSAAGAAGPRRGVVRLEREARRRRVAGRGGIRGGTPRTPRGSGRRPPRVPGVPAAARASARLSHRQNDRHAPSATVGPLK